MPNQRISIAAGLLLLALVVGCGSGEQKYAPAQKAKEITSSQRVREWLDIFSKSGTTDSGVSLIREELAKVTVPGTDTAALQTEFDAATNNPNQATRKKLAAELLKKIPEDPAKP
jgi:hypothetical protein